MKSNTPPMAKKRQKFHCQSFVLYLTILLTGLNAKIHSQDYQWAIGFGGIGYEVGLTLTSDGGGNIFAAGVFSGTTDFDPGISVLNLTSKGGNDIFIAQLDRNGQVRWVKQIGGSGNESIPAIATDAVGNVYLAGYFEFVVDFDPGPATFSLATEGFNDLFFLKLDPDGNFMWANRIGGDFGDRASDIILDKNGNVFLTGYFNGVVDFDPGAGNHSLSALGAFETFIAKYDSNGSFIWAKTVGGKNDDSGTSITIDNSGNIYALGYFRETADFDPGLDSFKLTATGDYDIYFLKLDAAGNFVWAKNIGGPQDELGTAVTIDNNGFVYATGYFRGTVDFDPGPNVFNLTSAGNQECFIVKLSPVGDLIWAKKIGGTSADHGLQIQTDMGGNIFTVGRFGAMVDFDPNQGNFNLTSKGVGDIFIIKLNSDGELRWAKGIGGMNEDTGRGLAVDPVGNVIVIGEFQNVVDFDFPKAQNLTAVGASDIFIVKYSNSSVSTQQNIFENNLLTFPNPTDNSFSVDLFEIYPSVRAILFNTLGQVVEEQKFTNTSRLNLEIVGESGFYFLQIETATKNGLFKILKQ